MVLYLTLSLTALCAIASGTSLTVGSSCPPSKEWNIMKLTQSWPPAVCIYLGNEKRKCEISSNITTWVIHGLWPTETGTECPNYCNDSLKFDVSQVQVLRPRLDMNWPSIDFDGKPEDSWKHEWEKHGTCGMSLPALKDEVHYFNVTLGLHEKYNLSRILQKSAVDPSSTRGYKAKDILEVLTNALGVQPTVTCVRDKDDRKYYLEQVEICLNKDFKPLTCNDSATQGVNDLLFKPEAWLLSKVFDKELVQSNIHDCGSDSDYVYYKPMPSMQTKFGLSQ